MNNIARKGILLLLPNMNVDTASAPNIWGKSLAKAFSFAGIPASIVYLGYSRIKADRLIEGVRYSTLPVLQSWMMKVPKVRSLLLPIMQRKYITKTGDKYELIVPLEGPYTIEREQCKVDWVKQNGAKYLFSILEHPRRNARTDNKYKYSEYMQKTANMYDIIMPITTTIEEIYKSYGRNKPIFRNPIVVDTTLFAEARIKVSKSIQRLLYCGNLCHEEEMKILLYEFSLVHRSYPEVQLEIIGGGYSARATKILLDKYNTICRKLNIQIAVQFMGKISHNEVLSRYAGADAFLLPRPFREYSAAGFPTKLGEYLACGKPVIAYGTGDIPLYLVDGESAYLVSTDAPGFFAETIIRAIIDSSSGTIGQKGADVAEKHFSIHAASRRIKKFFMDYSAASIESV